MTETQDIVRKEVLIQKKNWIQPWAVDKILALVKDKNFTDSTQYVHGKISVNKEFRSSTSYSSNMDSETKEMLEIIRDALFLDFFGEDADKWKGGSTEFDIIKYREGNELKIHSDYFGDKIPDRRYTIIIGLKQAEEGGSTSFPLIGKSVLLEPGDVLFFENLLADGSPNINSHHLGEKVIKGEKMIAVIFINDLR